jgi:3-oxoacyl-[acyl-carrier-protein] synthase II
MTPRRVVITGIGPVTAAGVGRAAFFAALEEGASAVGPLSNPVPGGPRLGAELTDFQVEDYLEHPKAYLDRASQLAFAAMALALEDANIDMASVDRRAAGLLLGSAFGSLQTMQTFYDDLLVKGARFVKPFIFPHTYPNTAISLLALEYGLSGYHMNFAAGAMSSACALIDACDMIRRGGLDMAFAGGCEAISDVLVRGMAAAGTLSPCDDGEEDCNPFAADRNGFVLGEGAAVIVLEEYESARRRGAGIYAEITGAGLASAPAGDAADAISVALERAMRTALEGAGDTARRPGLVLANANGSPLADGAEADAIGRVFGDTEPAVTTVKPLIGETLGASAALQLAAALAVFESGMVPAGIGPSAANAFPALDFVTEPRLVDVDGVLTNVIDSGGGTACIRLALVGESE